MLRRVLPLIATFLFVSPLYADDPSIGATAAGQTVADALREFTDSEVALVPAGVLKDPGKKEEAASALAFATDGVAVINVTGAKLREALERAVSAFPQSSVGFLQISGLEVTFKKNAPANARIVSVLVNGTKLDDARSYSVAMPQSLKQGQLGYANLWEDSKIVRPFNEASLATVVKGRRVSSSVARWSSLG